MSQPKEPQFLFTHRPPVQLSHLLQSFCPQHDGQDEASNFPFTHF